ncbi:MAG: methyltransferase domain-containing protein [Alphaproteobacteria bacterium]|nr:methyltransferase domain-containing protein [Alphaproteobacteria bacterium]
MQSSLEYICRVYDDYLRYGDIERFHGDVCEIGPGDNFGFGIKALGNGAKTVVAVDRFFSRRDEGYQKQLYARLADKNGWQRLFDGEPSEKTIRGLQYVSGRPAEEFFRDGPDFDFIVSRAVMEHLYDPLAALNDMSKRLRPDGKMIHRVDLRDHGMFVGHHPLTFLTIGEGLYGRMTRHAGRPNRVLLPDYEKWLSASAHEGQVRVTRLAGVVEEVEPAPWEEISADLRERAVASVRDIRHRLNGRFAAMSDRDLAISGFVLVVKSAAVRSEGGSRSPDNPYH